MKYPESVKRRCGRVIAVIHLRFLYLLCGDFLPCGDGKRGKGRLVMVTKCSEIAEFWLTIATNDSKMLNNREFKS